MYIYKRVIPRILVVFNVEFGVGKIHSMEGMQDSSYCRDQCGSVGHHPAK